MKKNKLLPYIAFLLLFFSCSDEYSKVIKGDQFAAIYMAQAKEPVQVLLSKVNQTQTVHFGAAYGGLNLPNKDIIITFKESPELVDEYNEVYGTDYEILPSSAYSMEGVTATIDKGTSTSNPIKGSFFVNAALLKDKVYLLPISIASNSRDIEIKKDLSTTYFIVSLQYQTSYEFNIFAGTNGVIGDTDGQGSSASFKLPKGLALDDSGNLYVADNQNHRIRKISSNGVVTTFAGTSNGFADGPVSSAKFSYPTAVAIAMDGTVYVVDQNNHRIRKITTSGMVATVAGGSPFGYIDGQGTTARFKSPEDITIDKDGNLYVADKNNHLIRKIDINGNVTTFSGSGEGFANGQASSAKFKFPSGVAVDNDGNVFVADRENHLIRKVDINGNVTTVAGEGLAGSVDGPASTAKFSKPIRLKLDAAGNLYITEEGNKTTIRKIDKNGNVSTLEATKDGTATKNLFTTAFGIAVDPSGSLYVSETDNAQTIIKLVLQAPF